METIVQNMPGYRLNEYMLVLAPHEELRKKIQGVKKEFAEKFDAAKSVWGRPHVLLSRFTQYEMMEERIRSRLRIVAMGFHPTKIELRDFSSYPSHTIHIPVISREPVKELIQGIREAQRMLKPDSEHKPFFTDEPHIIIASKLQPWQYEAGWREYAHRHFTGRFIADSMLMLKRRAGDKSWQIVENLAFQNLPVNTRQGELFG